MNWANIFWTRISRPEVFREGRHLPPASVIEIYGGFFWLSQWLIFSEWGPGMLHVSQCSYCPTETRIRPDPKRCSVLPLAPQITENLVYTYLSLELIFLSLINKNIFCMLLITHFIFQEWYCCVNWEKIICICFWNLKFFTDWNLFHL